jgi:Fe-S-cluster containining protein
MFETNLDQIAALAAQSHDDTRAFSHYIDIMWEREGRSDAELDALVDSIAATVIPHIDCTECANCCRSIAVGLIPDDVPPLARALDTTPQRVIAEWVDRKAGSQWGEWGMIRESPCSLLRGTLCSVYAQRPQSCRDYPAFTPNFRWLKDEIMRGAGKCPIIFNVIERLKDRLGW